MYTHVKNITTAGLEANEAGQALIMLHGRGSTAGSILTLASEFDLDDFAVYAPQATQNSWYPFSFMAPVKSNEPALSSALKVVDDLVKQIVKSGTTASSIYFLGFSQGACLMLEYVARHAKHYGGAVAFTGGLIGDQLTLTNYKGDFNGTPILLTSGDPDTHVPLNRVEQTALILQGLNADITLKVFKGRPHTITGEEIDLANQVVF